jgi:exo-beta-1,3-glucanase (GH17 family)
LILFIIGLWFWQQNQPVPLVEPQLPADGKFQCISYAPYYGKDQSPFVKGTLISKAQIDADLKLLSQTSQCVRIYSVGQGLDYVPEAASKIGLKVLLGAWIGWSKIDNELEVNLAIKLANQYPQTVVGLIVGNEVLLRGEQTERALAAYILKAKQATPVPVTYADVWEFWLKHPAIESSVDYVTVHILPYWEDDPQPIDNAIHHVDAVMDKLSHTFKKPIMIGETGWPSAGRHRREPAPSSTAYMPVPASNVVMDATCFCRSKMASGASSSRSESKVAGGSVSGRR